MKTVMREEVFLSESTAIADDKGNRVTYKELAQKAERVREQVEERSLVFLLCDHQIETLEFLYTMLSLNRVPLLLASDIDEEMLDHLIEVYRPSYIYFGRRQDILKHHYQERALKNHILAATGLTGYPLHPELALLLSTSGTTGSAKLVKLSYENLYDSAERMCQHLGLRSGQKGLSPLPLNHVYGLMFYIWHWHCGAAVLVTEEMAISRKFHDFYVKEKINNFAATPYTYRMLQRIRFWDPEKIAYLHCATSGGAPMPEKEQKELVSVMGKKFWNMYGTTETASTVLVMNFNRESRKWGSVGKPVGKVEAEIEAGTNELIIKGKSVCMGYAEDGGRLAEGDINRGILHTGDIASEDGDGYLYIKGRRNRYVKILDRRTSLDEIERYLNNQYVGAEFTCIGRDDRVFLFYTGVETAPEKEILALLDHKMKIPSRFISFARLEQMPRKETGKTDYRELERRISDAGRSV